MTKVPASSLQLISATTRRWEALKPTQQRTRSRPSMKRPSSSRVDREIISSATSKQLRTTLASPTGELVTLAARFNLRSNLNLQRLVVMSITPTSCRIDPKVGEVNRGRTLQEEAMVAILLEVWASESLNLLSSNSTTMINSSSKGHPDRRSCATEPRTSFAMEKKRRR